MECYHCAPMHPELVRLLPAFRSGATQEYGLGTRLADDAEGLTMSGRAPAPPFPGLAPGHERHYYGLVVRPNMLLNLLPDHVIVHTLTPLAPDRSRVTCDWLFAPEVVAASGLRPRGHGGALRPRQPPGLGGLRVGPGGRAVARLRGGRRLRRRSSGTSAGSTTGCSPARPAPDPPDGGPGPAAPPVRSGRRPASRPPARASRVRRRLRAHAPRPGSGSPSPSGRRSPRPCGTPRSDT